MPIPRWLVTVLLLVGSNTFMIWAWYGHLRKTSWTLPMAIGISWLIALPEYILQVPANRIGHVSHGGAFTAPQLKIIQEAVTLAVFTVFSILILRDKPRVNDYAAFVLIFAAVGVSMIGRERVVRVPAPATDAEPHQIPTSPSTSPASAAPTDSGG